MQLQGRTLKRSFWWNAAIVSVIALISICYSSHFENPATPHLAYDFLSLLSFGVGTLLMIFSFRHETGLTEATEQKMELNIGSAHGLYSVMRSPKEVGFLFLLSAFALLSGSFFVVITCLLFLIPIFERIVIFREASLLQKIGDRYTSYLDRVPLFYPKLKLYRVPHATQSWSFALKSTSEIILPLSVALAATEGMMRFLGLGIWPNEIGLQWEVLLAAVMISFLITRSRSANSR